MCLGFRIIAIQCFAGENNNGIVYCLYTPQLTQQPEQPTVSLSLYVPHFSPESQLKQSGTLCNTILWSRFISSSPSFIVMKGIPVRLLNLSPCRIPGCYIRPKARSWHSSNAGQIIPNKSNTSPSASCEWLLKISRLFPNLHVSPDVLGSLESGVIRRFLRTTALNRCRFRAVSCFLHERAKNDR